MNTVELVLYVLMVFAGIALVSVSVNLIRIIKINRDKRIEEVENKLNKNLTAVGLLTIAVSVLFLIDIIIR